jgi:hypothetical protein
LVVSRIPAPVLARCSISAGAHRRNLDPDQSAMGRRCIMYIEDATF